MSPTSVRLMCQLYRAATSPLYSAGTVPILVVSATVAGAIRDGATNGTSGAQINPKKDMADNLTLAPARIVIPVHGMTCANCAARVQKRIEAIPGVERATVNSATDSATVHSGPTPVPVDHILAAVAEAGYTATRPGMQPAQDSSRDRRDLFVAAALTLPLLIQMIAMTIRPGSHMPAIAELLLATPVQFWVGRRFYVGARRALADRAANMDVLVALGTSAAYGFSVWLIWRHGAAASGHLYFEASAVVITLVLLGKYLESRAKTAAAAALRALLSLRPEVAQVLRDGAEHAVPIADVAAGDIIIVRPGERLPVDGTIRDGASDIDESIITGEPLPVARRPGDRVISGAINGSATLRIHADRPGTDSTVMRIADMVEAAQSGKAPIQKLVDRISGIFVPVVIAIAAVTLMFWWLIGGAFEPALIAAVSVLVIACPCALGLATPTALVAGTGVAARHGILIKDIETLERAARIDRIVFDKTGTLTMGRPTLAAVHRFDDPDQGPGRAAAGDRSGPDKTSFLTLVAAAQTGSEHPIGRAIVAAAPPPLAASSDYRAVVGEGMTARVGDLNITMGRQAFAAPGATPEQIAIARDLIDRHGIVVWAAINGQPAGLLALDDIPRDDAQATIARLDRAGIAASLLTGDTKDNANRIGAILGIDDIHGSVRPDGKAAVIKSLRKSGQRVAMVGDGINDAPALAMADVGVAMGSGTDVAMETAGITLLRPQLGLVADAMDVARVTSGRIRQNLFWAFLYNVICIPVAAMGLLSPALAGAAMALSSVSVVANSLRLKLWRPAGGRS